MKLETVEHTINGKYSFIDGSFDLCSYYTKVKKENQAIMIALSRLNH